jgi:RHS repeat-associated protein
VLEDGIMLEARDGSGSLIAQYFLLGEAISGTSYFYTKDRIGSIREMTTFSGALAAQYSFDLYGKRTKLQGTQESDFQYARYYFHQNSGLNLTLNRAYNPRLGRWTNRDPIGEQGGINPYVYVGNRPIFLTDLSGLSPSNFVAGGGYTYDPWQINCVGYAAGIGAAVYPGKGQSFGSFIGSLPGHVTCTPTDPNSCPNCKCPPGRYPFVFQFFISQLSSYTGDPFNDPRFADGNIVFHAFAPRGGGSGFEEIQTPMPVGSTALGGVNPNPHADPNGRRYCCCTDYPPFSGP